MSARAVVALVLLVGAGSALAEQSVRLGAYTAHYIAFPSTFIDADTASRYDIVRGRNRALINVSVLDAEGRSVTASVSGTVRNLPGQVLRLEFTEVPEGEAVYYLAQTRYTDREVLRFSLELGTPDGATHPLEFQQTLYWRD